MDKKTEEVLTKDSLYESEKIFDGKHYSEFDKFEQAFSMLKFMNDNEAKKEHLKNIGDTHWGITWDEFKNLIESHGFIEGLKYDLKHEDYTDEVIIYYHPQKGLIIYAESYWGKERINGGNLYGEIQANSKEDCSTIWKWLSSGGCIDVDNMIYETSHDIREGLFSKLETLESAGRFLPKWTNKNRFLWFVDYIENKIPGYDYKTITRKKIMKCPKELQDIVGVSL